MKSELRRVLAAGTALCALLSLGTAQAALVGRDIDGTGVAGNANEAVFLYDTVLDITWLRNANVNGLMSWSEANAWAANLTVGAYDDWRLPTLKPVNGAAFNYDFSNNGSTDVGYGATGVGWGTANEMGHLFYATLGNRGSCAPNDGDPFVCTTLQPGAGLANSGALQNLQSSGAYWFGHETAPSPNFAWVFGFGNGNTNTNLNANNRYAFAVRAGDVAPATVPIPAALPLLLAGLATLGVVGRRGRARVRIGTANVVSA